MLDKVPASVKHASLLLLLSLLVWVQQVLPGVETLNPAVQAVLASAVTFLVAYLTPLTKEFGSGSEDGDL